MRPLQNPIFGAFLRDALLERLKIFQYYLRVLRCYHFELHSNLGFCKGLSLHFLIDSKVQAALSIFALFRLNTAQKALRAFVLRISKQRFRRALFYNHAAVHHHHDIGNV
ncbi:Uncharacterised protein [Kingella kingae]|nr:Uncharacterised protein [Kingella kingae]